jgi:hypothetical protein
VLFDPIEGGLGHSGGFGGSGSGGQHGDNLRGFSRVSIS